RGDFFQREGRDFESDRPVSLRQFKQRPIAAPDHLGALLLLDGGESEIQMEQREEMQRTGGRFCFADRERRVHAVTMRSCASASLAAAMAEPRDDPVASTIAADGRLSPAGGMMSPGFAGRRRSV